MDRSHGSRGEPGRAGGKEREREGHRRGLHSHSRHSYSLTSRRDGAR